MSAGVAASVGNTCSSDDFDEPLSGLSFQCHFGYVLALQKRSDYSDKGFFMSKEYPQVRQYLVSVCSGCYNMMGEMCTTPGCMFWVWASMEEVGEYLDHMQIRPLIDGRRYRLGTTLKTLEKHGVIAVKPEAATESIFN